MTVITTDHSAARDVGIHTRVMERRVCSAFLEARLSDHIKRNDCDSWGLARGLSSYEVGCSGSGPGSAIKCLSWGAPNLTPGILRFAYLKASNPPRVHVNRGQIINDGHDRTPNGRRVDV